MLAATLSGCQKDPLKDIDDGSWNKERNILNIGFSGQIGKATIVRNGDEATIEFVSFSDDFSAIEVTSLEVSYGATASIAVGAKLNFDNTDHSATVTVQPVNGEPLTWTIKASSYSNPYAGTWKIQTFRFKWDDWNGWGLQGEDDVAAKMTAAAAGTDDVISFSGIEGVDPAGAFFGTYERTAGANGNYGTYFSPEGTDWSTKFGQLPNGKGKYYINADNTVSVEIDGSGIKLTAIGMTASTETTLTYELNSPQSPGSEINWVDYYGTENQLKMAYQIWYILLKQ